MGIWASGLGHMFAKHTQENPAVGSNPTIPTNHIHNLVVLDT